MNQPKDIFEVKNIPTRTIQLSCIGLMFSIAIAAYFFFLGLLMSAVMIGCFSFTLAVILIFQLLGKIKDSHAFVILAVCVLLIFSSIVEGAKTGQYFFFFPLVNVIHIVVDSKSASRKEFILTYAIVVVSFAVCFYLGHANVPIEYISTPVATKILYSNISSAVFISLLFSIANIFYEKKFIAALDTIAHIQSHEMRKPIASIIALMDIWKQEGYVFDEEITTRLEQTVDELDEKIKTMIRQSDVKYQQGIND
jgi:hypothetical protein